MGTEFIKIDDRDSMIDELEKENRNLEERLEAALSLLEEVKNELAHVNLRSLEN